MQTAHTVAEVRAHVRDWRRAGLRIGLVPTMGNLHDGHYSLVELARRHADRIVASVFVNPTQFGPHEDFARYPRTLDADREGLTAHGCDLLFAPAVEAIYPFGDAGAVRVAVPALGEGLEGAVRPGHFAGVATVVTRLFNIVQPDVAVFGRKDYQQLLVVQRLASDLHLPLEILPAPTVREAHGLAMSSRNRYLSAQERKQAGTIHQVLLGMREAVRAGQAIDAVEAAAHAQLEAAGFAPDYAVVRRAEDLLEAEPDRREGLIALIAARLGTTRLIDNMPVA